MSNISSLTSNNTSANETISSHPLSPRNNVSYHHFLPSDDHSSVYLNPNEFHLPLSSNPSNSSFDVVLASGSVSSSHFNSDPLVRHFFHYRSNETHLTSNYYSSIAPHFDYPYPNETSISHSYIPSYPSESFSSVAPAPVPPPVAPPPPPPPSSSVSTTHEQNIYPWMRRMHNHCQTGKDHSFVFLFHCQDDAEHRAQMQLMIVSADSVSTVLFLKILILPLEKINEHEHLIRAIKP